MSPPIISAYTSTPTQSRQHQHPDHFSPGLSRPNTMSRTLDLESTVEEWVNILTSPLSTPPERISILNEIENTLVSVTDPSRRTTASFLPIDSSAAVFWALQATAGYSLAEVLLGHVYRLHLDLARENELCSDSKEWSTPSGSSYTLDSQHYPISSNVDGFGLRSPRSGSHGIPEVQRHRVQQTVSELCIALTILQGLTLCSKVSKRITQRKASLELLLQIVLSDYCTQLLPPILDPSSPTQPSFQLPDSPPTPTPSSSSKSDPLHDAPLPLPSGFALDLLMCILVDSQVAQERLSDMGGIHQIVQLSHKCADSVTTPASTPVSATSPSFAQAVARSSYVTALKQTDLGCLEFRYFWSQLLQGDKVEREVSEEVVPQPETMQRSMRGSVEEASTPKASPRKRVSRTNLREQRKAEEAAETPKATTRRRVAPPSSTRATSEEAPSRPNSSHAVAGVAGSGSPRKLRQSTSVAELRKKPTSLSKSSTSPPPLPPLPPAGVSESPIRFRDPQASSRGEHPSARPSTSDSQSSLSRERKDAARRSTYSECSASVPSTPSDSKPGQYFNPSRPGMSSRDRPRIPSPLKSHPSTQDLVETDVRQKPSTMAYRRLRASTSSTPFDSASRSIRPAMDIDENRNPFQTSAANEVVGVRSRQSSEVPLTPTSSQRSGMSSASSTSFAEKGRSSLSGSGSGMRIPPSPAVRRAQLARARSLSPTKMCLPLAEGEVGGES